MAQLPLITGGSVTVDEKNLDLLRHFKWRRCGFCGHVFRTVRRNLRDGDYTIYLAAEIMGDELASVLGGCNPCPALRD